ncbi:DUF1206 domain-containing protein [Oerskovia sp. M15]
MKETHHAYRFRPPDVRAAQRLQESKGLRGFARAGYAVSGLLHIMIGIIAVRIATGSGGGEADQTGALQEIAGTTGGAVVLWFAVVAFVALGIWQVLEAVAGAGGDSKDQAVSRAKSAGKAVIYLALGLLTFQVVSGAGSGGGEQESLTASLLANGAGRVLAGAVGSGSSRRASTTSSRAGRGASCRTSRAMPGAGRPRGRDPRSCRLRRQGHRPRCPRRTRGRCCGDSRPEKAGGLDAALRTIGAQPFGAFLLTATGVGFAAYGVYSFARARYARM